MASGTPVVCSRAGSLDEVVGDAALTADPENVEALTWHAAAVLTDPTVRAVARRARARARRPVQLGPDGGGDDRRLPRRPREGGLNMCGIVGILRFDGRPVRPEEINAMNDSIRHRGPDDHGVLVEGGVGIGMRRLSIVDLSAAGHQPLFNEDESVAVVFNGEIYNHRDLRSRLAVERAPLPRQQRHRGARPRLRAARRSRADRSAFEGMFAFALYDRARRKLFLARDGFGIKPLYVRRTAGQLSFASEIRALALDGEGPLSVDPSFTRTYLRLGYVPSPARPSLASRRSRPGRCGRSIFDTGETRVETFYRLTPAAIEDTRPDALVERLRELLNASVRRHLMADVPTGLFLSGGLDSSALTLFANHHGAPPKTFSMGFSSSDRGDETHFAAPVARRAGNENVRIDLGPANLDDLDPIIDALEEPLADSAVLPLWYLCGGTAPHVKVALSGEGGDEVLGGYARYFWGPVVDDLRPFCSRTPTRSCAITARLPSRSFGPFNVARRAAKVADSIAARHPGALPRVVRHLHGRRARATRRRRRGCGGGALRVDVRLGARAAASIPCSGCSTSTVRPCCSTTCS